MFRMQHHGMLGSSAAAAGFERLAAALRLDLAAVCRGSTRGQRSAPHDVGSVALERRPMGRMNVGRASKRLRERWPSAEPPDSAPWLLTLARPRHSLRSATERP